MAGWFDQKQSYALQQSNLYAANSIEFKLRSVANDGTRKLTGHEIEILSITEHNRWNVERLLVGFRAYKKVDRLKFKALLLSNDEKLRKECECKLKYMKQEFFIHKDIAPYDELLEESKKYDSVIVGNIIEVL